ncbi:MAG: hypothetical protein QNJ49_02505 [Mastigocoleus sp. MO_167.B18]|nr:hypothetical protein [Mastigocoleus sp. MO_167.B18]
MTQKSTKKNLKVRATSTIWGYAVGMLGVCIPLVAITESGIILPLLVILGTGAGTVAVWFAPDRKQVEEGDLTQAVKALEERVINLETIYTSLPDTTKPFPLSEAQKH